MEAMQNNDQSALIKELSIPLFNSKGWMKLVGVLMIIYGALVALTIVGILVAWLPIWMGVLLFQAANAIEEAQLSGQKEALVKSMDKIKTYFTVTGILTLIGLILGVLGFIGGIMGGIMSAGMHNGMM
jgi:1,4-dihydroxy-2-naphthoate octaprenyltransferase